MNKPDFFKLELFKPDGIYLFFIFPNGLYISNTIFYSPFFYRYKAASDNPVSFANEITDSLHRGINWIMLFLDSLSTIVIMLFPSDTS
jgi:hypothetical protein